MTDRPQGRARRAVALIPGIRRSRRAVTLTATLCALLATASLGGTAAQAATTPVTASPTQVAAQLFVAGDVGRLSTVPSGTESLVLEKVLQQLYADNPGLPASDAVSDIQGLQSALSSGGAETSPATLTVMSGNERILAILQALEGPNPPAPVALAVTQVARRALTDASNVQAASGQYFDASADTLSTLSLGSFSPAVVLEATVALAGTNASFAVARNQLWSGASHESLGDSTTTLLGENPALKNDPQIQGLVSNLTGGGFSSDVNTVLATIKSEQTVVADQTCAPSGGPSAPGSGPPSCSAGALHDAELIAAQCPHGISGCSFDTAPYTQDPQNEATTVADETAAETAEAGLLGYANAQLQTAEQAAAETSAQITDEENQYLNAQALNQGLKTGEDVVGLVATLSVSEIDPVAAIGALFNVVNDAVGYGVNAPDPNMIIVQGLQNISQQISDFEQYTQAAFASINAQLGSLSQQIAQETYQLNAQLTNTQNQITTLGSSLSKLQSSVDQLQAEIQSLFVAGANNDLGQVTSQWLGYRALNGTQIPAGMFGGPAGQLYQDATGTAVSQTVLSSPGPFDALDAATQLTASSSDPLDTNINYFDFFGQAVSDAPSGPFLGTGLTSGCAARASGSLCLPNPDFWASSTRAFAQLLLENPNDVTQARANQLQAMIGDGSVLQQALSKISSNDAGTDAAGTGSKLLDGLISYYQYWADQPHPTGTPPSLQQALLNEEQAYLASQPVSNQNLNESGIDPWGGVDQFPDLANLLNSRTFSNVPLCEPNDPPPGYTAQTAVLPHLSQALLFGSIPNDLLNAVRLGATNISVCWIARFDNGSPGGGNPGNLTMSLIFMGSTPDANSPTVQDPHEIGYLAADPVVYDSDLAGGDGTNDAEATVLYGWQSTNGATDFSQLLQKVGDYTYQTQQAGQVAAYNDPITANELTGVQQGIYNAILSNGSTLTTGTSQATNVAAAAQRLEGANTLLNDYVRLGFPQALASDDSLQNLINGAESDVFAYPGVNAFGTTTLPGVTAQLVQYYEAARSLPATFDPATSQRGSFAKGVTARVAALIGQLGSYVRNGRASGQDSSAAGGGALAEASPLVSSTLDRLNLSADVLADTLNGTIDAPPTTTTTTTTTTSSSTSSATTSSRTSTATTTASATTTSPSTTTTTAPSVTTTGTPPAATATTTTAAPPAHSTAVTQATSSTSSSASTSTTSSSTTASPSRGGVQAVTVFVFVPVVVNGNDVTFTVRCVTATCQDQAVETVVEHLVGNTVASISAKGRAKATTRTVVVGSSSFTLAAGGKRKLLVTLNATGRSLLKRWGSLPVTLNVTQRQGNGRTQTIRTTKLVVRAARQR